MTTRAEPVPKLLDCYEPHPSHIWKAIVLCELVGGEQHALRAETDGARFFAREALPGPLRSGAATRGLVERALEHREHPEWPADFD